MKLKENKENKMLELDGIPVCRTDDIETVKKLIAAGILPEPKTVLDNYIVMEYDCCPICGGKFHVIRNVTYNGTFQVGGCWDCKEDLIKSCGTVSTIWSGKSGWKRSKLSA